MADFSVRVELHGADSKDYQQLREALRAIDLIHYITVTRNDKVERQELPTAEYVLNDSSHSIEQVFQLVCGVIAQTLQDNLPHIQQLNEPPTVVVTEIASRLVGGLKPYVRKMIFPR